MKMFKGIDRKNGKEFTFNVYEDGRIEKISDDGKIREISETTFKINHKNLEEIIVEKEEVVVEEIEEEVLVISEDEIPYRVIEEVIEEEIAQVEEVTGGDITPPEVAVTPPAAEKKVRNRKPKMKTAGMTIEWEGESYSIPDLARKYGLAPKKLRSRIKLGWELPRALELNEAI